MPARVVRAPLPGADAVAIDRRRTYRRACFPHGADPCRSQRVQRPAGTGGMAACVGAGGHPRVQVCRGRTVEAGAVEVHADMAAMAGGGMRAGGNRRSSACFHECHGGCQAQQTGVHPQPDRAVARRQVSTLPDRARPEAVARDAHLRQRQPAAPMPDVRKQLHQHVQADSPTGGTVTARSNPCQQAPSGQHRVGLFAFVLRYSTTR